LELEIPTTFASFTVEIPKTFALDRSVREAGPVAAALGVVATVLGVELPTFDQIEPGFAVKEMLELHAPNPFRFFARTSTL
jgi:hypothetical protein